ncbi:MAG: hypothetical protein WCJ29_04835 [bacterium]
MRKKLVVMIAIILTTILTPFSALAFSFSPPRMFITLAPGQEKSFSFQAVNETPGEAQVHVQTRSFIASAEAGKPLFVNETPSSSLAPFVILSATDFKMKPDEKRNYSFTVKLPNEVKPGSYYGAIHFSFSSEDNGRTVIAITGPLVFLTVLGETEPSRLAIASFKSPTIESSLPTSLSLSLRNDGNNVEVPSGEVVITNIFKKAVRSFKINPDGLVMLPSDERNFILEEGARNESIFDEFTNFGIGKYNISVNVTGSQTRGVSMNNISFWILPWKATSVVVVFSAILAALLGYATARKRKSI